MNGEITLYKSDQEQQLQCKCFVQNMIRQAVTLLLYFAVPGPEHAHHSSQAFRADYYSCCSDWLTRLG